MPLPSTNVSSIDKISIKVIVVLSGAAGSATLTFGRIAFRDVTTI